MAAVRLFVTGKVQGVCFRASARDAALRLGLRGHALNLPDGRVDVLAVGAGPAIDAFREWLQHGPPLARVESVQCREADENAAGPGFAIG